jgi:hypothetical protein
MYEKFTALTKKIGSSAAEEVTLGATLDIGMQVGMGATACNSLEGVNPYKDCLALCRHHKTKRDIKNCIMEEGCNDIDETGKKIFEDKDLGKECHRNLMTEGVDYDALKANLAKDVTTGVTEGIGEFLAKQSTTAIRESAEKASQEVAEQAAKKTIQAIQKLGENVTKETMEAAGKEAAEKAIQELSEATAKTGLKSAKSGSKLGMKIGQKLMGKAIAKSSEKIAAAAAKTAIQVTLETAEQGAKISLKVGTQATTQATISTVVATGTATNVVLNNVGKEVVEETAKAAGKAGAKAAFAAVLGVACAILSIVDGIAMGLSMWDPGGWEQDITNKEIKSVKQSMYRRYLPVYDNKPIFSEKYKKMRKEKNEIYTQLKNIYEKNKTQGNLEKLNKAEKEWGIAQELMFKFQYKSSERPKEHGGPIIYPSIAIPTFPYKFDNTFQSPELMDELFDYYMDYFKKNNIAQFEWELDEEEDLQKEEKLTSEIEKITSQDLSKKDDKQIKEDKKLNEIEQIKSGNVSKSDEKLVEETIEKNVKLEKELNDTIYVTEKNIKYYEEKGNTEKVIELTKKIKKLNTNKTALNTKIKKQKGVLTNIQENKRYKKSDLYQKKNKQSSLQVIGILLVLITIFGIIYYFFFSKKKINQ